MTKAHTPVLENLSDTEGYKLRFLLKQKALPEHFLKSGEGFSEESLSKVHVKLIGSGAGQKLSVYLPSEINGKTLENSGLRLSCIIRRPYNGNTYIVPVDHFKIVLNQDLITPLQDLINAPLYLADVVQNFAGTVTKLAASQEKGELIKVISIPGDTVIIKLRDDVQPILLKLYGISGTATKGDPSGGTYAIPFKTLVEGSEKAIAKLRQVENGRENLSLMANKLLGTRVSVAAHNMICDGIIGVGIDAHEKEALGVGILASALVSHHISHNRFNLGERYDS